MSGICFSFDDVLHLAHFLARWRYDVGGDGYLDLEELKITMERLGAPQTHLSLKNMIKEVDEDHDNKLSFREVNAILRSKFEPRVSFVSGQLRYNTFRLFLAVPVVFLPFQFLLVFRKAAAGQLVEDSGLSRLAALTDIDVAAVGVSGAATFFESKVWCHLFLIGVGWSGGYVHQM